MEGRKCQVHKIQQLERPLDDDRFHFQDGDEDDVDDVIQCIFHICTIMSGVST